MNTDAPQVICMGEILIDFAGEPRGVGLAGAESFKPAPGGAPANVAMGLARLGVKSAFVGMVGDDAFGELLRETLENDGVDTRSLAVTNEQPTTLAFVALDDQGVPTFAFYRHPGADLSIKPDDVDESIFESAKVFHFGSLSLVESPAYDTTFACLERARDKGLTISYDPNYRPALWPDFQEARSRMLEPLEYVNILKVSEEELQILSGDRDILPGCESISSKGPRLILVTRGEKGMLLWNNGETIEAAANQHVNVADTTGCGDASIAGLLTGLIESGGIGREDVPADVLSQALNIALHCATQTAQKHGAIPALPHRESIGHLLSV